MTRIKHWDPQENVIQPLPPKHRTQPGRPSKKKRRKEAGEGEEEGKFVKRPKRQNNCRKCGGGGHNQKHCQNLTLPPQPAYKGGRPFSTDIWCSNQRKKKERKAQALKV